jgi:hypothetical protein
MNGHSKTIETTYNHTHTMAIHTKTHYLTENVHAGAQMENYF